MIKYKDIDNYIASFPEDIQMVLDKMRAIIKKAAPKSVEVISYGMPAFKVNGVLVYFAAWKTHIGFYPTSSGISAFKKEFVTYKSSKGAVQFPIDKPLPAVLITKIVKFRIKEDMLKAKTKRK
jgi:uncharacterized protein YdhG (YjbR/CyaY superfamily)